MTIEELCSPQSEAGIISTLIYNPDFYFHADDLKPQHFYNSDNGYIYYAISELAKKGATTIDAYNIMMILSQNKATENISKAITCESLDELIQVGRIIARDSVAEYLIIVEKVLDMAFRRTIFKELEQCRSVCFKETEEDIKDIIYTRIDRTISEFSGIDKIPKFGEIIDDLWAITVDRHNNGGMCGLPSMIDAVNEYFTYEKGELILVCAARKEGKSFFAINEIMHKLNNGKSVLHVDTEISSRQNMERILSFLTKIPVKLIKNGKYPPEDEEKITRARDWIKSKNYTHIYMPTPNLNKVYSIAKRMKMAGQIDFIVYDYIKSQDSISSSEIYNIMGNTTNFLKNKIAGELDLPILALAQTNRGGEIADSFKLEQFSSTVAVLKRKSPEEIRRDGERCGNYKFFIKLNRLGEQMGSIETDYIDLYFNGNVATFEQAEEQHVEVVPF